MMDRTEAAGVTVDRNNVWRVGEDHRGAFLDRQRRQDRRVERVAAQHAMPAEDPQISDLAERRISRQRRQFVCRVVLFLRSLLE
jgi:hypothetical protein